MAVYPAQLTTEEKNLKKRYARLQEKRKQLRKLSEKASKDHGTAGPSSSPVKLPQREGLNPKEAKEAAKKLLSTGKLTIQKQPARKTGFKRVGELPGQAPAAKKPNTGPSKGGSSGKGRGGPPQTPPKKPKVVASEVKELYSRFVKASKPDDLERIPKRMEAGEKEQDGAEKGYTTRDCTVYVECPEVPEEALRVAFGRFGEIQSVLMKNSKGAAFLTFPTPDIAATVKKEMNGGMIRGSDVYADLASDENGYVELPPEAASNPWSVLAAGRNLADSPSKKPDSRRQVVYDVQF